MSIISRDPSFSWAAPLTEDDASERTTYTSSSHTPHSKPLERRIVSIWKTLTRSTRRKQRVSVYTKDFVFVTAAASRRKSMLQQASDVQLQPRSSSLSDSRGNHMC
ncbi:hypothetical protein D9756_002302 [Leucocoprinus leucothites]|uniref:Uncharacterized protein n=1 Tax=Leucocoprinus leucothites TaxID=201217 RepID=A0A8H5GC59_9AGAR|nr:hypothetical protein D9756_002302 [Leucoagaricus leucothites]